jgi:hypothetical protein
MPTTRPKSFDRETLISTYLRYLAIKQSQDFWAWDVVMETATGPDAEGAWDLVVELLRRVPAADQCQVAAGPLEHAITAHGEALVGWIEGEARRDPRFKEALGQIWLREGELTADVQRRIIAASGGLITPLPIGDEEDEDSDLSPNGR